MKQALLSLAAQRTISAALAGFILTIALPEIGPSHAVPTVSDVGVWKLDLAKSHYNQGSAPKSSTLTIRVIPGTSRLLAIRREIDAEGQPRRSAFIIMGSGKVYAPPGAAKYAHDRRAEYTGWSDRNTVHIGSAARSSNGKTLRFTIKSVSPLEHDIGNFLVYDKQSSIDR